MRFDEGDGDHWLKRCELAEFLETRVDFGTLQGAEALHAESLAAEAPHDGAVDYRAAQLAAADVIGFQIEALLSQIADKSPRKAVSGAGGIENVFQKIARHDEHRVIAEQHGAVLA